MMDRMKIKDPELFTLSAKLPAPEEMKKEISRDPGGWIPRSPHKK